MLSWDEFEQEDGVDVVVKASPVKPAKAEAIAALTKSQTPTASTSEQVSDFKTKLAAADEQKN
jgi:hypothetical protein